MMRVISLVPSLTETLLEAGVDVAGRTRFCIHPESARAIPTVGGTKDINWDRVRRLGADFLLVDREENPKSFADESPVPVIDVHVRDLQTCAAELRRLGEAFGAAGLGDMADRFDRLRPRAVSPDRFVDWIRPPQIPATDYRYVIWRDPLMVAGGDTYIGDVLRHLGITLAVHDRKYPVFEEFDPRVAYLFSTEPFPFARYRQWASSLGSPAGLVDGESFSWFGVRSLRFLEGLLL